MKRIVSLVTSLALAFALTPVLAFADGAETVVVPEGHDVTNPCAKIELADPAADRNFYVYSYEGAGAPSFPSGDFPYYKNTHTVTVKLTGEDPSKPCDDVIQFFSGNECDIITLAPEGKISTEGGDTRTVTVGQGGYGGPAPYTVTASSGVKAENLFLPVNVFIPSQVTVNHEKLSVTVGGIGRLVASNSDATWSSSDPAIATVSDAGVVTGVADGVATISATYTGYGLNLTGTCTVTVGTGKAAAAAGTVAQGKTYTAGSGASKAAYKVTSASKRTVTYTKCALAKSAVTVPAKVTLADGKSYKVTGIAAKAFKAAKKVRTVTVKSSALTKASVKNCLKGSAVTKVKTVGYKAQKAYFAKGNSGKKVTVSKA